MREPGVEILGLDQEPGYWIPSSFSVSAGE